MKSSVPRLRLFAGPNGSGKSTLKTLLRPEFLGGYLNPDEIESEIRATGSLDLARFGVALHEQEIASFFRGSRLFEQAGWRAEQVSIVENGLSFRGSPVNSYVASATAEFLCGKLLAAERSFTLETVMSHASKC